MAAMFVRCYPDETPFYINLLFMFAIHDTGIIVIITISFDIFICNLSHVSLAVLVTHFS
jgi:hypothetical protein